MALVKPKTAVSRGEASAAAPLGLAELAVEIEAPEASRRRSAVRALAGRPDALDLLWDRLPRETAASVRTAMFTVLVEHPSPEVAERLGDLLDSEDAMLRNAAIEALQAMPEEADSAVASLLSSPDSDVRIFAVNVLAVTASDRAPGRLVEVLERDDHVNVCAAAVDGLTEIGTLDAIPALEAVVDRFSGSPFMVFAAETAIQRIRGR